MWELQCLGGKLQLPQIFIYGDMPHVTISTRTSVRSSRSTRYIESRHAQKRGYDPQDIDTSGLVEDVWVKHHQTDDDVEALEENAQGQGGRVAAVHKEPHRDGRNPNYCGEQ